LSPVAIGARAMLAPQKVFLSLEEIGEIVAVEILMAAATQAVATGSFSVFLTVIGTGRLT